MTIVTVFIHHDTDAVTRDHWQRCCHFAPGPVVTVSATDKRLPQGLSVLDWPKEADRLARHVASDESLRARSTDLLLLAWFRNRNMSGSSYFVVEWDTLVNCSIEQWLKPVRDYLFSAPSIRLVNREPEWHWFRHRPLLPESLRPFACGVVPFTCLHIQHELMSLIERNYPTELGTANGELRFATVAARCGAEPVAHPGAGKTITWQKIVPIGLSQTIYHPIKSPIAAPKPWMQPHEIAALAALLHPTYHVLEYGAGGSTFWLAERVRQVTSIEYSAEWIDKLKPLPANVKLHYVPAAWPGPPLGPAEHGQYDAFVAAGQSCQPDLVLIDGRARVDCARMWAGKAITVLHDADRGRYQELDLQPLAGSLALVNARASIG